MALSPAGLNNAANGVRTNAGYISLHSADPGTTGASELSGGSPAYARKAATWSTAADGTFTLSGAAQFDVPAGSSVSHFGLWSAASGGTFQGGEELVDGSGNPAVESFASQGLYTLTSASVTVANPTT